MPNTHHTALPLYKPSLFSRAFLFISASHGIFPLLFLLSKQCIFIMKELDQQINNDSNHHPFGIVTDDQICHCSRMPKASCQMVNNLSRTAMSAASTVGKCGLGSCPSLDLDLEPCSLPCWLCRNPCSDRRKL